MKIMALIPVLVAVAVIAAPVAAEDQRDVICHYAFDRTVWSLKTNDTVSMVRTGADGIKVTCTIMPKGQVFAVAWEIYNPKKKLLDIEPADVKLLGQTLEYDKLLPAKAISVLYGTTYEQQPIDPFIDAQTPPTYDVPVIDSSSQQIRDIYASAFNFGKDDSSRILGLTYYTRYGKDAKLTAVMNIDKETFKFEF